MIPSRFFGTTTYPQKERRKKNRSLRSKVLFRSVQGDGGSEATCNTLCVDIGYRETMYERRRSEGMYEEHSDEEELEKAQMKERNSLPTVIKSNESLKLKRWYSDYVKKDNSPQTETSSSEEPRSPKDILKSKTASLKRWFSLTGHEQPYSIKMSYVRDALGNSDDMVQAMDVDENEIASQIQFILRPTKKAPTKVSLGMLTFLLYFRNSVFFTLSAILTILNICSILYS